LKTGIRRAMVLEFSLKTKRNNPTFKKRKNTEN